MPQDDPYLGSIYEGLRVVNAENVVKHPGQLKRCAAHRTSDIERQRLPALSGEVPQGLAVLLTQLGAAGREPQRLLWVHGNTTEGRHEGAWHHQRLHGRSDNSQSCMCTRRRLVIPSFLPYLGTVSIGQDI